MTGENERHLSQSLFFLHSSSAIRVLNLGEGSDEQQQQQSLQTLDLSSVPVPLFQRGTRMETKRAGNSMAITVKEATDVNLGVLQVQIRLPEGYHFTPGVSASIRIFKLRNKIPKISSCRK